MVEKLFDFTNIGAYFLWESTKHYNAIDVWYCAEDIASYFERNDILTLDDIREIIQKGKDSFEYTELMRNISFRVFIYTNCNDSIKNWFACERILYNTEWLHAMLGIANCFRQLKKEQDFVKSIRSKVVQDYYYPFSQNL